MPPRIPDLDGGAETADPEDGLDTDDEVPGDVTPIVPAIPSEALVLANVGDSRTYLFRHGRLRRVTIDHSYVQELIATGHLTEDEARNHPRRNIITRALGIEPDVRVDWWTLPLIRGDRFLACSDGLVDEVNDDDIAATLLAETDPQRAADRLVEQANASGGRDNITVVVVDVIDGDDPPDPTQELDVIPLWADASGFPTPAGPLELDADSAALGGAQSTSDASTRGRRRTNVARFAIGFMVATILVVGFVVFSAWARNGYFVAFDDQDQAIIYKGRPGGVLWIDPTAESKAGPEPRRARTRSRRRHRRRAALRLRRRGRRIHPRRCDDHHHDDDHDDDDHHDHHDAAADDDRWAVTVGAPSSMTSARPQPSTRDADERMMPRR